MNLAKYSSCGLMWQSCSGAGKPFHKQNKFYQQKYGFATVTGTTSETGSGQGWSELFSPTVWKGGWIERWQYLLLIVSY